MIYFLIVLVFFHSSLSARVMVGFDVVAASGGVILSTSGGASDVLVSPLRSSAALAARVFNATSWGSDRFSSSTANEAADKCEIFYFTIRSNASDSVLSTHFLPPFSYFVGADGPQSGQWQYAIGDTGPFKNLGAGFVYSVSHFFVIWRDLNAAQRGAVSSTPTIDTRGVADLQLVPTTTYINFRLLNFNATTTTPSATSQFVFVDGVKSPTTTSTVSNWRWTIGPMGGILSTPVVTDAFTEFKYWLNNTTGPKVWSLRGDVAAPNSSVPVFWTYDGFHSFYQVSLSLWTFANNVSTALFQYGAVRA